MFNMETVSHYNMTETETKSAAELRKQNKPLMEKRRRARINDSLNKLKSLVLDAMKRDTSRYSKLEKADILEMTVKHLRAVQRQQMAAAMASDTTVVSKYRAGFVECASEVTRYLNSIDGLDPQVRNRLMGHLSNCTQKVTSLTAMQEARSHPMMQPMHVQIPSATPMSGLPGTGYTTSSNGHMMAPSSSPPPPPPQSMGGEGRISGAFQMVPGSLHGGQFAVLVPSGDGYALSSAPASHLPPSSAVYTGSAERPPMQSYGSLSSTSPSMTSPMSLTSPTSDRVFRYGSASSDASSSEEEEVEVALDMRVEPCRDVNANIIKPTTSQADHRRMTSSPNTSRDFQVPRPQLVPAGHGQGQGVKAEDMWRPW